MPTIFVFDNVRTSVCEEVCCYVPSTASNHRLVMFEEVFWDLPCDLQEILMPLRTNTID